MIEMFWIHHTNVPVIVGRTVKYKHNFNMCDYNEPIWSYCVLKLLELFSILTLSKYDSQFTYFSKSVFR